MTEHPEHIVRLISTPTEMEAGIMMAALEAAGIKATMTGAATAGFRAEAPGEVQILVAEADVARARRVLDESDDVEVDWSQVDIGEPEEE